MGPRKGVGGGGDQRQFKIIFAELFKLISTLYYIFSMII